MADVDMAVLELTRATGDVDTTNAPAVAGNDGTPFFFPNDGQTLLICVGGAAGCTITFVGKNDEFGRAAASLTFVVGIGKTAIVGPFSPHLWNNTDGEVEFTLSANNADDYFEAVRITNSERNGA